jgi:transposase-like protein
MSSKELNGLSPAILPARERSEVEQSETKRSGGADNIGAFGGPHPNPEVVAKAKRRTFTASYKERILAAADAAQQSGQIGALLRREGLYSSLLATWRKERAAGITQAMSPHKRGPKSKQSPLATENAKLQRENLRLADRLRKAEIIIDVQKKLATLLGLPLRTPTEEELL